MGRNVYIYCIYIIHNLPEVVTVALAVVVVQVLRWYFPTALHSIFITKKILSYQLPILPSWEGYV